MKRTPFRSKPLRQRRREGADVEREVKPWAAALSAATLKHRAGTYAGGTSGAPIAKEDAYRDPALIEMARGRPCLLLVPGVCSHRVDTVVACHSNWSCHGKAGARKADDCYSAWGCAACHGWLDAGKSDGTLKQMTFLQAHLLQVLAWRQIAADTGEPERFRKAALRALARLKATPVLMDEQEEMPNAG